MSQRITLAYPWSETKGGKTVTHKPDTTLTVDDATAGNLILEGWARPADADDAKKEN